MPITGAVVLLPNAPRERQAVVTRLSEDRRVSLGPEMGGRLAIVVEAPSTHEGQELLKSVQAMTGVGAVLPVFHDFSDEYPEVEPRSEE
ncbi:MAG: hypothetical protein KDC95_22190 [Planctomycetes bacterium]|nr:hypothetical protein [Planctomycetota bacterium]